MSMNFKSITACVALAATAFGPVAARETLAEATKGLFLMGVAVNQQQVNGTNPKETELVATEFSTIVAENCMKPEPTEPREGEFNFTDADKFVAFGEKNKQVITGHTLIWHSQIGRWFFTDAEGKTVTPEVLKARMRKHIMTVVGRYKGRIKGWDVVNEALEDNGTYRNSQFYRILGKDFIKFAFQYAHEADPNAELYYNDYNLETPAKTDAAVQLVKDLKAAGCRIDAVGSQGHMKMINPTVEATELMINKLRDAGVKVMITEWDISILPSPYEGANISTNFGYTAAMDPYKSIAPPDSVMQKWNKRILDMFALYLKHNDVVDRVTVWGLSDAGSWLNDFPIRGRTDYPLLFDRQFNRKTVVDEMIKMAKNTKVKK
jgi:endo-1,4-beta-xylanase